MSDIKTALSNALNDKKVLDMIQESKSKGVSIAVFDYIKSHPGVTVKETGDALEFAGYKKGSISSTISQLHMAGKVSKRPDGKLYVLFSEYTPISRTVLRKAQMQAARERTRKLREQYEQTKGPKRTRIIHKPAEVTEPATIPQERFLPSILTSDDVINRLSLVEAKKLYKELHEVFGKE